MTKDRIKVMIVDDHLVVREGLKQILEIDYDIEVVGEADSGSECLRLLEEVYADIVLMDVRMPGIGGIETTRIITRKYPQTKVVMLTIYDDDQLVTEAIEAGAKGYVLKKITGAELAGILRHVAGNRPFLDPRVATSIFEHIQRRKTVFDRPEKRWLTERELEILQQLVGGSTDRHIAESLAISPHTVRSHLKNIYRKLGVTSRSQAVAKSVQEKIVNKDRG
jgi:NarL family two-component system response regulator YdfI